MATSRGTYSRTRVRLTAQTIATAARLIEKGHVQGRGTEFADTETTGLTLRVTSAAGTWYLRHRKGTIRLGSMDLLDLPAARHAAHVARTDLERGVDPRLDVQIFAHEVSTGASVDDAHEVAFPEIVEELPDADRRRRGPWQWRDLMAEFLAAKAKGFKPGYLPKYGAYHRGPEFKPVEQRELASLRIGDLERLRDRVAAARTVSAAARVVSQNREALDWAYRYHRDRSGLSDIATAWWRDWDIEYRPGTREHTPTVEELARTLVVAELHRDLGSTGRRTESGMLAALWGVVLTGQRTGALGRTRRAGVIAMPDRPGWEVWTWTGAEMKGGRRASRPHALPIPPEALAAIARCGADPDSRWLFPSRFDDKHATPAGFTGLFHRLEGITKAGKGDRLIQRPAGDLFARYGIRVWTPHDVRRTLATFLDDEGLGGAGSAILAHSRGKGSEEERTEDITRRVYAKAQRLELKARGMEVWVPHVLAAYEREYARLAN